LLALLAAQSYLARFTWIAWITLVAFNALAGETTIARKAVFTAQSHRASVTRVALVALDALAREATISRQAIFTALAAQPHRAWIAGIALVALDALAVETTIARETVFAAFTAQPYRARVTLLAPRTNDALARLSRRATLADNTFTGRTTLARETAITRKAILAG
jgi:hypothetical protein